MSTFADTFASPVVIEESPPVLKLDWLSPEFAVRSRVLPITALFDWSVILLFVELFDALFVELAPFAVFEVLLVAPHPFVQLLVAFPGASIMSPV